MALPSKERRNFYLFIILVLTHLILLSIQVPLNQDNPLIKQAFLAIVTPVQARLSWLWQGMESLWTDYVFLRKVRSENQRLEAENLLLRQENLILRQILEKLEKEVEIKERLSQLTSPLVVASVIGSDAGNIFQSLILNRGSQHGIKADMTVLDPEGNLVGRVIGPVLRWSCRVQLITDEASGTAVITSSRGISGVLRGDGRGRCYLDYVLVTSPEVSPGEEIITSGLDGLYPAGIRVGRIISVSVENSLFKKIEVDPFFQINGLRQVAIIRFDLNRL